MIKKEDIAWVAGLLEGEGCFTNTSGKHPRISLDMTDLDVVEKFAELVGATGKISSRERGHYKKIYKVVLVGSRAIGLMFTVYPFMGKRRRARIKEVVDTWRKLPDRHKKLSMKDAADIRRMFNNPFTYKELMAKYGVTNSAIYAVVSGRSYVV